MARSKELANFFMAKSISKGITRNIKKGILTQLYDLEAE
jgi:hypothetical protein